MVLFGRQPILSIERLEEWLRVRGASKNDRSWKVSQVSRGIVTDVMNPSWNCLWTRQRQGYLITFESAHDSVLRCERTFCFEAQRTCVQQLSEKLLVAGLARDWQWRSRQCSTTPLCGPRSLRCCVVALLVQMSKLRAVRGCQDILGLAPPRSAPPRLR